MQGVQKFGHIFTKCIILVTFKMTPFCIHCIEMLITPCLVHGFEFQNNKGTKGCDQITMGLVRCNILLTVCFPLIRHMGIHVYLGSSIDLLTQHLVFLILFSIQFPFITWIMCYQMVLVTFVLVLFPWVELHFLEIAKIGKSFTWYVNPLLVRIRLGQQLSMVCFVCQSMPRKVVDLEHMILDSLSYKLHTKCG